MADAPATVRTPEALVDLGRALGRDVPAALKRAQATAALIRAAGRPTVKKDGGKK